MRNIQDGSITVDAIRRMLIARVTAEVALSSGFQSYPESAFLIIPRRRSVPNMLLGDDALIRCSGCQSSACHGLLWPNAYNTSAANGMPARSAVTVFRDQIEALALE